MEDPDSKTVKVYISVPNENGLFKQNMFLKVRIEGQMVNMPIVPTTSIIYKDGDFYVHVKRNGEFALAKVKPIMEVEGKFTMVEGVREGDEVACSAIELETQ
jgi:multidrug efflux pump subunit AcrA (membrane-fusion protein)